MSHIVATSGDSRTWPPRVIGGKYLLRREIGRGGVGVVYLATKRRTGEPVVIKFLSERLLADPCAVARFEREAQRLGGVRHPNIVAMIDHGRDAGRGYLVMEYVPGTLLEDFIAARGRLSLAEFVPIAAQILAAVAHAHGRGLMIRDIKPSNVMLCERKGRANFVKVLDFGLAKRLDDEAQITQGHVMGTVGYLAPEALRGAKPDLRVDVYAIGVLFYFMLCGRMPFEGDEPVTVFYRTVHEPAPSLRSQLPDPYSVPRPIVDLVHACIAKDPDARPCDAAAVLDRLVDGVPPEYFVLPAARGLGTPSGRVGNTGMLDLMSSRSPARSAAERVAGWVALVGGAMALGCIVALALVAAAPTHAPVRETAAPASRGSEHGEGAPGRAAEAEADREP